MKIAISAQGSDLESQVDLRFGRAPFFIVIDDESGDIQVIDNQLNKAAASSAGVQASKSIFDLGVKVVISGNFGPNAFRTLNAAHIELFRCPDGTVSEIIKKYKNGELQKTEGPNVQGHWS